MRITVPQGALASAWLVFLVASTGATSPSFIVTMVPESISVRPGSGALSTADVGVVLGAAMGVTQPQQTLSWDGLYVKDIFSRPRCTALFVVDGMSDFVGTPSVAAFPLKDQGESYSATVAMLLKGKTQTSVLELAAAQLPSNTLLVSASAETAVPYLAGSASNIHKFSYNYEAKQFTDSVASSPIVLDKAGLVAGQFLGEAAVFTPDGVRMTVAVVAQAVEASFDLSQAADALFFTELEAMVAMVQHAVTQARVSPSVLVFAVSTLRPLVQQYGAHSAQSRAATALVNVLVNKLTAVLASGFEQRALVCVVTLPVLAVAHNVERRLPGPPYPLNNYTRNERDIAFCTEYACHCYAHPDSPADKPLFLLAVAPSGYVLDCDANCTTDRYGKNLCYCAWHACSCASQFVMRSQQQCIKCDTGFILTNGYCYVASLFPATINIVFWVSLSAILAIAAVWFSLHSIDGGKNSIIDRAGTPRQKTN